MPYIDRDMNVERLRLPIESMRGWVKSSSLSLLTVSGANWAAMGRAQEVELEG